MIRYHDIAIVVVVALCTMITRGLPFVLFGKNKKTHPTINYLGKILPPAVMAILIVYCLKDLSFETTQTFMPSLISVAAVVIVHLSLKNVLVSITVGTLCYMFMVQSIFT